MVFLVAARKLVLQGSTDGFPMEDCILPPAKASWEEIARNTQSIMATWLSSQADLGGRVSRRKETMARHSNRQGSSYRGVVDTLGGEWNFWQAALQTRETEDETCS